MGATALAVIPLIIGAGTGAMGATTSAAQARQAGRYERRRVSAEQQAQLVQGRQVQQQADLEQKKSFNQAHLIRSRIRVAAGESGIGLGGTYLALMRQADYEEFINAEIIQQNLATRLTQIQRPLLQERTSELWAGLAGGLGGLQAGLSIGSSITGAIPEKIPEE